jgi:hypothetical protein
MDFRFDRASKAEMSIRDIIDSLCSIVEKSLCCSNTNPADGMLIFTISGGNDEDLEKLNRAGFKVEKIN